MSTFSPAPSTPVPGSPPARMKPGHWVLLVIGVLLFALGVGFSLGGALALGASGLQRDGNYLTGETERTQGTGHALTSPPAYIDSGSTGMPAFPTVGDLASVQVRVSNVLPDQEVFVGIAATSDVDVYLEDVASTSLVSALRPDGKGWSWSKPGEEDKERTTPGNRTPAAPGEQGFWAVSASGAGAQEITWDLEPGQWSLVIMNADASRPVWVDLQAGARSDLLGPVGTGLLVAGLIGLVLGIPLILLGTAGLGRDIDPSRAGISRGPGAARAESAGMGKAWSVYPVELAGTLDGGLSRGLWLVKWLLAVPHYLVLALLWVALAVTTIAVGIVILFTGRYPRAWFCYNVGVLRWSWRVGFYGYSVLGTDRYPPFTLAKADYPADFDVVYPQRLSRGLVLVKWWLLAIPHLLVVGIFTSGTGATWNRGWGEEAGVSSNSWGPSLLALLVLIAGVLLLFTGRYRNGLFSLIMGVNRWVYRVSAYVLLMRDEYPPFRLDQGPYEPPEENAETKRIQTPAPGNQPPALT